MATNYLEQSLAQLKHFEGSVPWMYLDTVGKVTVGVGTMLPTREEAEALPFLVAERAATPAEIGAEFARVQALPAGRPSTFYRRLGGLQLAEATIEAKLLGVLEDFEALLRARLHGYDTFPDPVKMALLDMAYNLGPSGLLNGFPRLMRAVAAKDWNSAAGVCSRRGPQPARNEWTREMFLAAGGEVGRIEAYAEGWRRRLGTWWRRLRRQ